MHCSPGKIRLHSLFFSDQRKCLVASKIILSVELFTIKELLQQSSTSTGRVKKLATSQWLFSLKNPPVERVTGVNT
jgi:hypothetical protein